MIQGLPTSPRFAGRSSQKNEFFSKNRGLSVSNCFKLFHDCFKKLRPANRGENGLSRGFRLRARLRRDKTAWQAAAGTLVALWTGLLIRWWEQRRSLLRLMLFMVGTTLTFNLGRDITLLVLWPVIFAYFLVRLTEMWATRRFRELPQRATAAPANLGPIQVVAGRLSP